jgi:hypothetical protein
VILTNVLIGIVGACISLVLAVAAWQQGEIAKERLRLDLFDRRFKVFEAATDFLGVIHADTAFELSDLFDFDSGVSSAIFLFEPPVVKYLSRIRERALALRAHQQLIKSLPDGSKRSAESNAEKEDISWLVQQIVAIAGEFSPYMRFKNIR